MHSTLTRRICYWHKFVQVNYFINILLIFIDINVLKKEISDLKLMLDLME